MNDKADQNIIPTPLWTGGFEKTVITSMAISGELLFLATQSAERVTQHSELLVLDLGSGSKKWSHRFEYALISGIQPSYTITTKQNVIIAATRSSDLLRGQGLVVAFDLTGKIIWQSEKGDKSYSAPINHGVDIVVLAGERTLAVFCPDEERNSIKRIPLPANTSLSAPVVQDDIAYIPCRGPELVALDLDGSVRWHFRSEGGPHTWLDHTPALMADKVITVSRAGIAYCLHALTGELIWKADIGNGRALSCPEAVDGFVFVGTRNGLVALDVQNGQVNWLFETDRPISAAPRIIQNSVFAGCENHNLYALDMETGELIWRYGMDRRIDVAPVAAEDVIVTVDRGGNIVVFPLPEISVEEERKQGTPATHLSDEKLRAEAWAEANEPLRAAQLWLEIGELDRAARTFETAGSWLEAAAVWQQLDRLGKRAEALEQQALQMSEMSGGEDERTAAAWLQAARAYAEIGQQEARTRCEREAARYGRQPLLILEIEPEPMRINAWSKIKYVIHNEGFGSAREVFVNLVDDRFESYSQQTMTLVTIRPDNSYNGWLDVLPKAQGDEVPMRLSVEYLDRLGNEHQLQRTFHLPVVGETVITTAPSLSESEVFARLVAPDGRDLSLLRRKMVAHFTLDEIRNLIFDFGLRSDDFENRLSGAVRQLITWAVQTGRFAELIEWCQARRPSVDW